MVKKLLFVLLISLGLSNVNSLKASHVPGTNITYTCDPNNPLTYTFRIQYYRKCPGTHPNTLSSSSFTFTNSCGLGSPIIPIFTQVGPEREPDQYCNSAFSNCIGGTNPGIYVYEYESTVTLPANCDNWRLTYNICCRDASSNLGGGSSNNLNVYCEFNSNASPCNNSPRLNTLLAPYSCVNTTNSFCLDINDLEGDSIAYEMTNPLGSSSMNIAFLAGFSVNAPLNNFTLNDTTGCITYNHPNSGNYVIAVKVKSYANGVLISSTIYDLQITLINCANNNNIINPSNGYTNLTGSADSLSANELNVCDGNTFCYDVVFRDDVNTGTPINLSSNASVNLPGATFTQTGTNPTTGTVCWTASSAIKHSIILVTAEEELCPIKPKLSVPVIINIEDGILGFGDTVICGSQSAQLNATNSLAGYTWTPATGLSCSSCPNPIATPLTTTTYTVKGITKPGCIDSAQVTVTVENDFTYTVSAIDDTLCLTDSTQLMLTLPTSGGPYTYFWQSDPTLSNENILNPFVTPTKTTTYKTVVTSSGGCAKTDSIVIIADKTKPSVFVTPIDTTICENDTIQLLAQAYSSSGTCGLNPGCIGDSKQLITNPSTSTTSTSPFRGSTSTSYNFYTKTQHIYSAEYLNNAGIYGGTIKNLALFISSTNAYTYDNVQISIGCATQTIFDNTDFYDDANLTPVFGPTNNLTLANNDWQTFDILDWEWDGISSIVIQFCTQENTAGDVGNSSIRIHNTGARTTLTRANNTTTNCNASSGSSNFSLPVMRFDMCYVPLTNALFTWNPGSNITNTTIANPLAYPTGNTTYSVNVINNDNGCAQENSVNFIVNNSSQSYDTSFVCYNDSFVFADGNTFYNLIKDTNYESVFIASNGCDSSIFTKIKLFDTSSTVINDTICSDITYTLPDGSTVNTTGTYIDTLPNTNGCDSIITTNLVVNDTSQVTVVVNICKDSMYELPDGALTNTSGIYVDTLPRIGTGCDSIITTNLTVSDTSQVYVYDTICENENYTLPSGSIVNSSGTYTDTLAKVGAGCDSIITIYLQVNDTNNTTVFDTICSDITYTLPDESTVNTTGTYIDTLPNTNGCDSIITTNLTVYDTSQITVVVNICKDSMYELPDGTLTNTSGVYVDTLSRIGTGCDSIITTNLTVSDTSQVYVYDTICENENYTLPDGSIVNSSGTYTDTLAKVGTGCDSIITIYLQVNDTNNTTIFDTICSDITYTLPDGSTVNTTGTYIDTLPNTNGCDSIITTNLTVYDTSQVTVVVNICKDSMYELPDGTLTNITGVYVDTLPRIGTGCDSIITTNLTVSDTSQVYVYDTICENENYTLPGGSIVNSSGTYIDTLAKVGAGCDSIITIYLQVNDTNNTTIFDTICSDINYTLPDGSTVNTTGTYIDTLPNTNGCDSIITINLVVNDTSQITVMVNICKDSIYELPDGTLTNTTGIYVDTLPRVGTGCDSIITTNLTVSDTSQVYVYDTICENENYTLPSGSIVNTSGTYVDTLAKVGAGCDSIITIYLQVNDTNNTTIFDTICSDITYTLPDGSTVNTTGTYIDTLPNTNGCDSIITTNLTVYDTSQITVVVNICKDSMYELPDGTLTNTSGIYVDTLPRVGLGCDSIITTNLTVSDTSQVYVYDTICENENYTLPGGSIVNSSGTYIDTLAKVGAGCDSIITIYLQVNDTNNTTVFDTICSGDNYTSINGNIYTITGNYSDTLQTINQCDSIITINLEVLPPSTTNIDTSICNGDSLFINNRFESSPGTYSDTLATSAGCDSILIIRLSFIPTPLLTLNLNICEDDSLFIAGEWRKTSGTYNDTNTSQSGCDSITQTTLSIELKQSNIVNDTICQGEQILLEGSMQSIAGVYNDTLTSINGCDSIIQTNLSVIPKPLFNYTQDTSIIKGAFVPLTISSGYTYLWNPSTYLNCSDCNNPISTPQEDITYQLVVSNGTCDSSVLITILVIDDDELFIPTIFSPNKDGVNDIFITHGMDFSSFKMTIFNRWGEKIFETSDYLTGWDGFYRGDLCMNGAYAYIIEGISFKNEEIKAKGSITLIK